MNTRSGRSPRVLVLTGRDPRIVILNAVGEWARDEPDSPTDTGQLVGSTANRHCCCGVSVG